MGEVCLPFLEGDSRGQSEQPFLGKEEGKLGIFSFSVYSLSAQFDKNQTRIYKGPINPSMSFQNGKVVLQIQTVNCC